MTTPLVGSWGTIPDPTVAELVSSLGYDFFALDVEHSPLSYETVGNMLRAVDAADTGTETLVRVADDDPTTLHRTLDLGPAAILVPMVHTPAQAEQIVDAVRYPPDGSRGIGIGRSTGYGQHVQAQIELDDHAFSTHVQLESTEAIHNASAIANVDGIDGIFVGPMDLSLAMDDFGGWNTDRFQTAVEEAVTAARTADVAIGTIATTEAEREERLDWGIDYLVAGVDVLHVTAGATDALDHSRKYIESG